MIPASGSNTVTIKLHGKIRSDVVFVSDNDKVTISPINPASDNATLTITAAATIDAVNTDPVTIRAMSIADPTYSYGEMKAVVKPRIDGNVTEYKAVDPVNNLIPATVPTATSLQNYLNNVTWGKQANVFFTVDPSSPVTLSVHWDILPAPNGNGFMDDFQTNLAGSAETATIFQAIFPLAPFTGNDKQHTAAIYINQFKSNDNRVLEGLTGNSSHISFISGFQATDANSRENISAHEIGHGMGAQDIDVKTSKDKIGLMWPSNAVTNACEIRDREWRIVNRTQKD